jgi:hypothetical protein
VRAAALALLVAGCAGGQPVAEWTLGDGTHVTLPATLARDLPLDAHDFTLRATVTIDRPSTLVIDCFHGPLVLFANGREIADAGEAGVGEHRFVLPAADRLELELRGVHDVLTMTGFGTAPRLVDGEERGPGFAARWNHDTAIAELALILVFALLFGTSFARDRTRKQDAAFHAGLTCAVVAPLWQLGLLRVFGMFGSVVLGLGVAGTQVAVIYFGHFTFHQGELPRRLLRAYAVLSIANVLDLISPATGMAVVFAYIAISVVFACHVTARIYSATKMPQYRYEARVLLATNALMILFVAPDVIGFIVGQSPFGGAHLISAGVFTIAISQSIALGYQQATRQRALEQTAAELQRQIAERSRELADALGRLAQQPQALGADRTIDGRYRVIRRIGAGGMGAVYEVERTSDRARLALKTLRGRGDAELMARFAREAQIAAELQHPNLVPVVDVGIADGGLFLVMPLVDGGSLEHQRAKFGDAAWARPIVRQIAAGLSALHARGIVHRDLKPANVLLADGVARIADFGLASLRGDALAETATDLSGELAPTASPSPALTRAGDLFGTPAYMAPELAAGVQHVAPSSDVFALGLIAHELLTGRAAFTEPPVVARMNGHAIAPVTTGDPIVVRCLDLDPARRPSADELVRALG